MRVRAIVAIHLAAAGFLVGCGGGDGEADPPCTNVTPEAASAAFDGLLTFTITRDETTTCTMSTDAGTGDGLVIQRLDEATYERLRAYESSTLPFELVEDVGDDTFILNDSQLVSRDHGGTLTVALVLVTPDGQPVVSAEATRAGLIEVASLVLDG